MALPHARLPSVSPLIRFLDGQRDPGVAVLGKCASGGEVGRRIINELFLATGLRSRRRGAACSGRLESTKTPVGRGQVRGGVEIPVTCYQIIGVPDQAEKDEIVKSVMKLKSTEIEDGYTLDVVVARQELLMDVRDKLLFEKEYAGNARERILPKSPIRIPWGWLPGALCLLQEVGEEKLVLEVGKAALGWSDAKTYIHDVLLSMALAECSIAKNGFEKNRVAQGFEALARAQYLLRSKSSLVKMPLLLEIEESLEELAPACTLELLSMPQNPENSERRRGAIAALRELLRQGLDVESTCKVQDWPCFFTQALNKLTAAEIVDLLPWDELAMTRKNKKSLDSQNQRVIIDFSCFYMAMIAHIALGFSSRQMELISKAKTICESLVAAEGNDLKLEEAFCSFLLGQSGESLVMERLRQLQVTGTPASRGFEPIVSENMKDIATANQSLETWLKDAVIGVFPDTRNCSPSLVNFFKGEKRTPGTNRTNKEAIESSFVVDRRSSFPLPSDYSHKVSEPPLTCTNSVRRLGPAVKQLTPADLQAQLLPNIGGSSTLNPPIQLKRSLGIHRRNVWECWWSDGTTGEKIAFAAAFGCLFFATCKLLSVQFGWMKAPFLRKPTEPKMVSSTLPWSMDQTFQKLLGKVRNPIEPSEGGIMGNSFPHDIVSPTENISAGKLEFSCKRQMLMDEAETLVKQWQTVKAGALGPNHQVHDLSEVLAESMLAQWKALAEAAKVKSCYWRFVLLKLSILRAEVLLNEFDVERAEIDAVLEEAAELVDESQPNNTNYYSTYKIRYVLKRQCDGSWRFCGCGIETQV